MDQVIEQMLKQHNTQTVYDRKNGIKEVVQESDDQLARSIGSNELIKVKFEVDTNPPDKATFETKFRLLPVPFEISLYDMPSLFAGKIHAVICRAWKDRVKGRDLYDYVFYLSRGIAVNLAHLEARLVQSGFIPAEKQITIDDVKEILRQRFAYIDYAQARKDVVPYIKNPDALKIWRKDFFVQITEGLKVF
jgi:hypothetical protein